MRPLKSIIDNSYWDDIKAAGFSVFGWYVSGYTKLNEPDDYICKMIERVMK